MDPNITASVDLTSKTNNKTHPPLAISTASQALLSNQPPPSADDLSRSYENPNYRKLYAKLSMDAMINPETEPQEESQLQESNQKKVIITKDQTEIRADGSIPTEEDPEDLQFFYDEYEEDEEDEEEDEDEYFEDDELNGVLETAATSKAAKSTNDGSELLPTELPDGWERHEDELGPYFWHIPTGTIQREKPFLDTIDKSMIRSDSLVFLDKSAINVDYNPHDLIDEGEESSKIHQLGDHDDEEEDNDNDDLERKVLLSKKKIISNLRLTFPTDDEDEDEDHHSSNSGDRLNFVVHSLGWLDVDESQINPQTGSMVIKRCIAQLSTGRLGSRDALASRCWGPDDTQSLYLRLGGEKLCLLDPTTETVLSVQLIKEIRMWAVDEQNFFAYVVKERSSSGIVGLKSPRSPGTGNLKCHVFHCDDTSPQSAQRIALYLKDTLIRLKNKAQGSQGQHSAGGGPQRPSKLFFGSNGTDSHELTSFEFPTPIEEPKKSIPAMYMGLVPVNKPMGVEVLNMAIEEIVSSLKLSLSDETDETELMRKVWVHISPSNLVVECQDTGATLIECRVRYLSFLGISLDNVKRCGFIMQVDERQFVAHCFHAEPSGGALCKTIEAACKLRYQKCMDAHAKLVQKQQQKQHNYQGPGGVQKAPPGSTQSGSSPVAAAIKSTIAGVFSKIRGK